MKVGDRVKRAREATKRPSLTMKMLERRTVQTGETFHRVTIVWTLHKAECDIEEW